MAFDAGKIEATLDVQRNPFTQGLKKAQKDADDFAKKKYKATLDLEADTARARADLDALRAREDAKNIHIGVDVDTKPIESKLGQIEQNTADTAARSGSAIGRALMNPLVIQLALLPAVAAASATAAALALSAVPLAFGLIAVAANKDNKTLKDDWTSTWAQIKTTLVDETAPMIPYLRGIIGDVGREIQTLKPQMSAIFGIAGPQLETFTGGIFKLVNNVMPGLTVAAINSGKAVEGVSNLLGHVGSGLGTFFQEISYGSANAGKGADLLGVMLEKLLGVLGTLINQFSGAWASIGPQFVATFNQMLDVVLQFTQGGLSGMVSTLTPLLAILNAVLHVVAPFAAALGSMGGTVLGLVAAWKLLTGGVSLAAKAFDLIRPASIAAKIAPMSNALQGASVGFGNYVMGATLSGEAGNKAESGFRKVASAASKAAAALPILGAVVIGIVEAFNYFVPSADDAANAMMKGGSAATDMSKKIDDGQGAFQGFGTALTKFFAPSVDEVNTKIKDLRGNMTPLEKAQTDAAAAQNHLTEMTKQYGDYSPQAADAGILFANATKRVEEAQKAAGDATKTATDRIVEQTNLMLGSVGARLNYQQSLLGLETAQNTLADAVKKHGVNSLEARDADNAYQQALLATVQSVGAKAAAEAQAAGVTDTAKASTDAMAGEILRLATAAGQNAPPALQSMINGLSQSQLEALGASREIDGAGNAVYRLPNGKTLTFPNDAPQAKHAVDTLKSAIDQVPSSVYTRFVQTFVQIGKPATAPGGPALPLGANADGGPISGPGGPRQDNLLYWLSNGEFVVNAAESKWALPILAYINSGKARRDGYGKMADGGQVGSWDPNRPIKYGSVSESMWQELRKEGWKGRAGDNMEALYKPLTKVGTAAPSAASQRYNEYFHQGGGPGLSNRDLAALADHMANAVSAALASAFARGMNLTLDPATLRKGLATIEKREASR